MIKSNKMYMGAMALLAVVAAGTALGCMTSMRHGDSQGSTEVRSGIETGRAGIRIARDGLALFRLGNRAAGVQKMDEGVEMMSEGMAQMHEGVDMMSSGMMSSGMMEQCACGEQLITPMHDATSDMRQGRDMMADADTANDTMAADRMGQAMDAMEDAMQSAEGSMSCMDGQQGGGMQGGMM